MQGDSLIEGLICDEVDAEIVGFLLGSKSNPFTSWGDENPIAAFDCDGNSVYRVAQFPGKDEGQVAVVNGVVQPAHAVYPVVAGQNNQHIFHCLRLPSIGFLSLWYNKSFEKSRKLHQFNILQEIRGKNGNYQEIILKIS